MWGIRHKRLDDTDYQCTWNTPEFFVVFTGVTKVHQFDPILISNKDIIEKMRESIEIFHLMIMRYTIKLVNKGHQKDRHEMAFIYKWFLFEGFFVLFSQHRIFEVWILLKGDL